MSRALRLVLAAMERFPINVSKWNVVGPEVVQREDPTGDQRNEERYEQRQRASNDDAKRRPHQDPSHILRELRGNGQRIGTA